MKVSMIDENNTKVNLKEALQILSQIVIVIYFYWLKLCVAVVEQDFAEW